MAVTVACMGTALAVPTGAMALTTHSATTSTRKSSGLYGATAKCGANQHVVSGGFKTSTGGETAAVLSHAFHGNSWTVHLASRDTNTLTTYAYCGGKGGISAHKKEMTAKRAKFGNTTVMARCASGEALVSGGYAFLSPQSSQGNSPTYRDYAASAGAWKVTSAFENIPAKLAAFAYCQRGVNVKVRSSSSAPIPTGGDGSTTASCHTGETLLAGGYTTTPKPDWENNVGPDLFYNASYRSGARSWTASAHNFSDVSGTITAFAYCKA
jgi:hypothetical protein